MQEVSFEDALEIITIKDPRFPREAYQFVREALDHTQKMLARDKEGTIRHVSGQELLAGIKDFAVSQFGPMAMMVLGEWGIHCCQDFGEIVFNMVETGGCPLLASDDLVDYDGLADRLMKHSDPLTTHLWQRLSDSMRQKLSADPHSAGAREHLAKELNQIITSAPLFQEQRFAEIALSGEAKRLTGQALTGVPLAQFNRLLLELAFPGEIAKSHGLLAKTKNDSRADFEDGYDFFEAFRKPFLPPSKQAPSQPDAAHLSR